MKKTVLSVMKKVMLVASFLSPLVLIGAGMVVLSCSCDEEDVKTQAVEISFKTINEKGEYSSVFNSEENILFDLNINNNTGDTLFVNGRLFLEEVLSSFKMHSSGGAFIGYPFSAIDLGKFQDTANYMKPHESRHWQCLYMTHQVEMNLNSPFVSNRVKEPLSKGEYYLLYSLTLNNLTKTGKITIKII